MLDRPGVRRVPTTSGVLVISEVAGGRPARPVAVHREGSDIRQANGGSEATDQRSVKITDIIMH